MNSGKSDAKAAAAGRVAFLDGRGDLPMIEVTTPWSAAGIYLHGGHVTHFQEKGERPLLFLSQCSRFDEGQPIRGGIPIVFPWFGPREGMSQHGFARVKSWEFKESTPAPDGSVSARFRLPDCPEASSFPPFTADFTVTVSQVLALELTITNLSKDEVFAYEDCLHTYFEVGDINQVSIRGLKGAGYIDKVDRFARKTETGDVLRIGSEVDRTYLDATGLIEILDPQFGRVIRIEKEGSASTVVWNPWIEKAQQMPDFGNDEYQRMVCVESGNVASNGIKLAPGATSTLRVKLSTEELR